MLDGPEDWEAPNVGNSILSLTPGRLKAKT